MSPALVNPHVVPLSMLLPPEEIEPPATAQFTGFPPETIVALKLTWGEHGFCVGAASQSPICPPVPPELVAIVVLEKLT